MAEAGLSHYIGSSWIPDINLMINKVEAIANANSLEDLAQVIDVSHYTKLRQTDEESFRTAINNFPQISKPATRDNLEKALQWFMYIASFFSIERPSNGRVTYENLAEKEKASFQAALTSGAGRLFFNHCMTRIKLTIRDGKNVDPNDLYDMLQLILLRDRNRIFVTFEKSFFHYNINDPESQKVISWEHFRTSK